ncbi:MAG TPA: hypothetical protein VMB91_10110 [Solirubrobacteraceae bacterium]|nr:hypothetical protein [Solirubrobacteraceae bacterium]
MTNARRFALDELTLRPGTYFNPQTEIMIVVDDSPEVDHELFDMDEFDSDEWVLIAEDIPIDESRRDDLVERFQRTHQDPDVAKEDGDADLDVDLDPDEDEERDLDEEEEEDELDGLELEHE